MKYNRIYIVVFTLISFSFLNGYSQDIHFSQFYASPLTLNPAQTGNFKGDWRIMNSYRTQWNAISIPYITNAIGYDRQFYFYNENLSAGAILVNDKSGDEKLTITKFYLSGAYHKFFSENLVSMGLQVGFVRKSFSLDKLTFPEQYDNTSGFFSNQMPLSESNLSEKLNYIDANTGVNWKRKFNNKIVFAGLAIHHFNFPKESFFDNKNHLKPRISLNVGASLPVSDRFYFTPQLLYAYQVNASEFLAGTHAGVNVDDNKIKLESIYIGAETRTGIARTTDAFIVIGGLKFKSFDFGVSYDFNISALHSVTNYRGALELSIIYTNPSTLLNKIAIPCDRY